jgi:putative oxidoreductase
MISIAMLVAILSVHFVNGLFMSNNGYELGLALLVISISLVICGAGTLSLDNVLKQRIA